MKYVIAFTGLLVLIIALVMSLNRTPQAPPAVSTPAVEQTARTTLPAHSASASREEPDAPKLTNHFRDWFKDNKFPQLTPAQVEGYLSANHRSAGSLLGALYATGSRAFLREAMTNFPNDPKVAYAAIFFGNADGSLSAEQARQISDSFKRNAPDNSIADYASALSYIKSGQSDLALQDMGAAANLKWTDYTADFIQSSEEAYRSAGYSDLDAKVASQAQLLLPDLAQLKELSRDIASAANTYQQAGNSAAAQNALQMDLQLGQQLSASQTQPLITTLVGYAIENIALAPMDPNAPYGNSGQTVADLINQIQQQREAIKTAASQDESLLPQMSDDDVLNFLQRRQSFGELNAIQWAMNKYKQN